MPMQIRRTATPNLPPTGLAEGQLGIEMAGTRPRLWVGVPTAVDPSGRRLLVPSGATSSATAPASPVTGDLWYDTANNVVMLYDGSNWVELPSNDPRDGLLYGRRDGVWQVINIPEIPPDASLVPSAGQLRIQNSAGSGDILAYVPFNGGWMRVDGEDYPIPPATSAATIIGNAANCYIDGVGGQALAGDTLYYVYLFVNAGVLTMEFSATGHAVSTTPGNVGTEIKQSDDSRSLIGIVWTAPASPFFGNTQRSRLVRSWLNRGVTSFSWFDNAMAWAAPLTLTAVTASLVCFADDSVSVTASGSWLINTGQTNMSYAIFLDGAVINGSQIAISLLNLQWNSGSVSTATPVIEGMHIFGIATSIVGAGTYAGTGNGQITGVY